MFFNFDRVIFVERDCRQISIKNSILLRIQKIARCFSLNIFEKYIVIENWIEKIIVFFIIQRVIIDVQRYHDFQFDNVIISFSILSRTFFQSIFFLKRNEFRSILKLSTIKKKLKIEIYERNQFTKIFEFDVVLMFLMFFTNDFDLYRNMYRNLSKIYLTIVDQILKKKIKKSWMNFRLF